MKKILPLSETSTVSSVEPRRESKGFTLIELLIVVAIIAILAVIGLVILGGIPSRARDARRRADLEEISKAYEANYNSLTNSYQPLLATQFANGVTPIPPEGGAYTCVSGPAGGAITCNTASVLNYTVCADLEVGNGTPPTSTANTCTSNSSTCVCKSGQQASTASIAANGCTAFNNLNAQSCSVETLNATGSMACNALSGTFFIRCSDLTANLNAISTANCSVAGTAQLSKTISYYTTDTTTSTSPGNLQLWTINSCGTTTGARVTVNIMTTQP